MHSGQRNGKRRIPGDYCTIETGTEYSVKNRMLQWKDRRKMERIKQSDGKKRTQRENKKERRESNEMQSGKKPDTKIWKRNAGNLTKCREERNQIQR
jgi:hypothetical protein